MVAHFDLHLAAQLLVHHIQWDAGIPEARDAESALQLLDKLLTGTVKG